MRYRVATPPMQSAKNPMQAARGEAFGIAGLTLAADMRADVVDRACHALADLARQRRAAIAVALHPPLAIVDQRGRDARQFLICLEREARPFARRRAARAARHAVEFKSSKL